MIVATAGHIDHGKTTLVKALTGVDTDRLPEEKSRGISIDIGFAYLPIEGKGTKSLIGFVDVPGHERFVRNMIAGVCGIDYALVVVAADDGVMPQTIEHVQILHLLGIRSGLVVVTKTDRVEATRVAEVGAQAQALLDGTSLQGAHWLSASAVSGEGLPALREALVAAAQRTGTRYQEGRHFRYAVDRAFTIKGSGTVVTGTVFDGQVSIGDHLVVTPRGTEVRVRQIQVHGKAADAALAGQRCALNLVGVSVDEVGRGEWVLSAAMNRPSRRMEARCTLLRDVAPLAHWTPVDVHMGTARVRARISTGGADATKTVAPGETRILQLALERELTAVHGDRFILRDSSARHTLGGGVILDPFAPAGRRNAPSRLAYVAALQEGEPRDALEKLLAIPEQTTDLVRFAVTFNLHAGHVERLCKELKAAMVGRDYAFAPATLAALNERVMAALTEFHSTAPSAAQMEVARLRRAVAPQLSAPAFLAVLQAAQGKLEVLNSKVRLVHRGEAADSEDETVWARLMAALHKGGLTPPPIDKLAVEIGVPEKALKDLLFRRRGTGEVLRIPGERYYPKATMAMLAATAEMVAKASPEGMFGAAQFRDATGIPRDIVIPILEFLDSLAITRRIGDVRKMVKDRIPILGDSPPAPKPAVLPKATPPNPAKKKVARRW